MKKFLLCVPTLLAILHNPAKADIVYGGGPGQFSVYEGSRQVRCPGSILLTCISISSIGIWTIYTSEGNIRGMGQELPAPPDDDGINKEFNNWYTLKEFKIIED